MTNGNPRTPSAFPPAADLIDLEVGTYGKTDDGSVLSLTLLLEKADGVEFRKRSSWELLVSEEDLRQMVQKMNDALEQLT